MPTTYGLTANRQDAGQGTGQVVQQANGQVVRRGNGQAFPQRDVQATGQGNERVDGQGPEQAAQEDDGQADGPVDGQVMIRQNAMVEEVFESPYQLILTCLGCAVGTGNVWRFPRIVANNSDKTGGLVFLLVWFLFLFLWSIPMLLLEYGLGRFTRRAVVGSFRQIFSDKVIFIGLWIVGVSFFISCYYSVILGWCLYYTVRSVVKELPDTHHDSKAIFDEYRHHGGLQVLTTFAVILFAGLSVAKGLNSIKIVSLILVPFSLVILLLSFIATLAMPKSAHGLEYLFTPNWGSLKNLKTWIHAISQNAFDTGAGSGLMLTYSCYMTRRHGIIRYASAIPFMNNMISLVCAMTLFGGMFSFLATSYSYMTKDTILDVINDSGPGNTGLTFIWLPVLFSQYHAAGRAAAFFFFLGLFSAGLTSLMANMEMFTRTITDFGHPRSYAILSSTIALMLMSLMSALNPSILDNQDFVWGFGLVVNGLVLIGAVIVFGPHKFITDAINNYTNGGVECTLPDCFKWFIIFILPTQGVLMLGWWVLNLILDPKDTDLEWTDVGEETFLTAFLEWLGFLFLTILVNLAYIFCRRTYFPRNRNEVHPILQPPTETASEFIVIPGD